MKKIISKLQLQSQLIIITLISVIICFLSMTFILPNILTNLYEKNVYEILEQPLSLIQSAEDSFNENVAFIIYNDTGILKSRNYQDVAGKIATKDIMKLAISDSGKIKINGRTYYYAKESDGIKTVVSITNDKYIQEQKDSLNGLVIPAMLFASMITTLLLAFYSNFLVSKITKLKSKIDNFENTKYDHNFKFMIDDELSSLNTSLEKTRKSILEKEEYKRNMFQTISHELKTPIMVILSHIEAVQDKVITKDKALTVIKDETEVLQDKSRMILQINKLNYLKDSDDVILTDVDLKPIIKNAIERFSVINKDIEFKTVFRGNTIFKGDVNDWESVVDNILSNFIRYANKNISVKIINNKITFFNDGERIDEKLIDKIFEPYTIGKKGKTGLGLAIVKQVTSVYGYSVVAINCDDGVKFVIN